MLPQVEITRALSPQAGEELFELLPQTGEKPGKPVAEEAGGEPRRRSEKSILSVICAHRIWSG